MLSVHVLLIFVTSGQFKKPIVKPKQELKFLLMCFYHFLTKHVSFWLVTFDHPTVYLYASKNHNHFADYNNHNNNDKR